MDLPRLDQLTARFPQRTILVVGDYFLDKYLIIDRRLSEISLETNLEAYQVVDVHCSPGAAGTVASNLRALGTNVIALGIVGEDGQGFELQRELLKMGVNLQPMIQRAGLLTPTYTKPIVHEGDGRVHEIQRLDIKNRCPLSEDVEYAILSGLQEWAPRVDGVIVADQTPEEGCGVVTRLVRDEIARLAAQYSHVIFAVDSRKRIGKFRNVIIKPNSREAILALGLDCPDEPDLGLARECGATLYSLNSKPVFLTAGKEGILLFTEKGCEHIPAIPVNGEIDIVGAGDSCMAALVLALCSGADLIEAAFIGNLAASVTIQQIGCTGTASPAQLREQF
jgi:rfaE bifunctional protein kinase chain/domain